MSFQGLHSASLPGILSLDIYQKDSNRIITGWVFVPFFILN